MDNENGIEKVELTRDELLEKVIGMSVGSVGEFIVDAGFAYRFRNIDGSSYLGYADLNMLRISINAVDGVVTEAWFG